MAAPTSGLSTPCVLGSRNHGWNRLSLSLPQTHSPLTQNLAHGHESGTMMMKFVFDRCRSSLSSQLNHLLCLCVCDPLQQCAGYCENPSNHSRASERAGKRENLRGTESGYCQTYYCAAFGGF